LRPGWLSRGQLGRFAPGAGWAPADWDGYAGPVAPWTVRKASAERGTAVRGHVGDRLVVHGRRDDEHNRVAVITELRHADGTPPYLVRWLDDGHEGLVFPGPDATIEPERVTG
jgi:hypothetical protein